MGWWPSIFGGGGNSADPLKQLDPKLREFLDKESPAKYKNSEKSAEGNSPPPAPHNESGGPPAVPPESLYQDGRYAHLWKNYRPQAEIEAESMTDHDRLMSVVAAYQERKSQISKIALENCAEAQEEWINCMKHGQWEDQLQMCRHQVRRFEKCFTMQSVSNWEPPTP